MIHSIQCSQNPANSREDANAEANVKFFNTGEMDIMETIGYTHIWVWKLQMLRQSSTDDNLYLGSTEN